MLVRAFLTEEIVERALERVALMYAPDIEEGSIRGRPGVYIVVLDEDDGVFGQTTLGSLGSLHEYAKSAITKAEMANREQCDTGEIIVTGAHLLAKGDTYYRGGVCFESFSVGASGLNGYDNEAVSRIVGALIIADCARELESAKEKGDDFIQE